jgi:hypothetical protein
MSVDHQELTISTPHIHPDRPSWRSQRQGGRKGSCQSTRGVEECDPLSDLIGQIPGGDDQDRTGEEARLSHTEEESTRDEAPPVLHNSRQSHDQAPGYRQETHPVGRADFLQDNIRRDLCCDTSVQLDREKEATRNKEYLLTKSDIGSKKDALCDIVLVVIHVESLRQPLNLRISFSY